MRWTLKWSKDVEVLEGLAAAGKHVPAIEQRPSLLGYQWLWDAFLDLSSCRYIGMSVGPIPWTAVQKYAEVNDLRTEESYLLHGVIRHMDGVWMEHQQHKAEMGKTQPNPKAKPAVGSRAGR